MTSGKFPTHLKCSAAPYGTITLPKPQIKIQNVVSFCDLFISVTLVPGTVPVTSGLTTKLERGNEEPKLTCLSFTHSERRCWEFREESWPRTSTHWSRSSSDIRLNWVGVQAEGKVPLISAQLGTGADQRESTINSEKKIEKKSYSVLCVLWLLVSNLWLSCSGFWQSHGGDSGSVVSADSGRCTDGHRRCPPRCPPSVFDPPGPAPLCPCSAPPVGDTCGQWNHAGS